MLLNHIPHLKQQTTPEDRFLALGGAVDLRSDLFSFLKSPQANFKSDVGSYTLRFCVSIPGLEGPGLRGELPLDSLSLCPVGMGEEELLEDELEKGLATRCGEQFKPTPFPLWGSSQAHQVALFSSFCLAESHFYEIL